MGENEVRPVKVMRLRYAGRCRECGLTLAAGTTAAYDGSNKTVICQQCSSSAEATAAHNRENVAAQAELVPEAPGTADAASDEVFRGVAGASARRENERRKSKRETRIRDAHPVIGGFMLAMKDDPQSTKAWAVGARGEEALGRRLDGLERRGVRVLHDRRVPGARGNIDHIAIAPSGVFVIDAKLYKGKRPTLRVEGGIIRVRTEKLIVGSRDETRLVDGVLHQVELVESAIATASLGEVPVRGMLCFVEADWPLIGGRFVVAGVDVVWPGKAAELILKPGPIDDDRTREIYLTLALSFPSA